ncbi:UDP-N-acetyl glucosamine 2-epimerase [Lentzea sp. PSKA42]|uniref:UDP-N-acetyl glucosamine 2-epimerase n=1 Tax=Lentzea indica TaxID=2604800 RepID=A0ABX1F8Z9_9PSEU|nr:UDP-N-acetyl glucosamine 2-epimerase [Lentzea indica]
MREQEIRTSHAGRPWSNWFWPQRGGSVVAELEPAALLPDVNARTFNVHLFIGARPNIPKAATVQRAFRLHPLASHARLTTVHTGQHSSKAMASALIRELGVDVDHYLRSRTAQTDPGHLAQLVRALDQHMKHHAGRIDSSIVVGDVNSTVAASIVSARYGIPVVHVEAGLRSHFQEPEELNRKLITAASSFHLPASATDARNLIAESVDASDIFLVGNAHTETLLTARSRSARKGIVARLKLTDKPYTILYVHKPATIRNGDWVSALFAKVQQLSGDLVIALHPGAKRRLLKLAPEVLSLEGAIYVPSLSHGEFSALMRHSACVVTDSAGLQEESTVLGTSCITVGAPTARPVTCTTGSATFVGFDLEQCSHALIKVREPRQLNYPIPPLWDTEVSQRISNAISEILRRTADNQQGRAVLRVV